MSPQHSLGPVTESPDPFQQQLVDERSSSTSDTRDSGMTTCTSSTPDRIAWVPSPAALVLPIQICEKRTVALGHSFAAMAAREFYLRGDSGIVVRRGAAEGPNNALGEVRLLLTNERCEAIQVQIRFRDQLGRQLLFRSTGGHVLHRDPESGTPQVRTHPVRGVAAPVGYEDEETYAQVGCYSFFDRDESAAELEPRLASDQLYMEHHDGPYRTLVGGSDNAQRFHHSEQAFFKLLYDYPGLVVDALKSIITELADHSHPLVTGVAGLRLAAMAIDVFTTRSACSDCQTASLALRNVPAHFLGQVRRDLASTLPEVTMPEDAPCVVRIACAVPFLGCPSAPSDEAAPSGSGTVHALPSTEFGASPHPLEPELVPIGVKVNANVASCMPLLSLGSESREQTAADRYYRHYSMLLPPAGSPDEVVEVVSNADLDPGQSLLLALRIHAPLEKQMLRHEWMELSRRRLRLSLALKLGCRRNIDPQILFRTIVRNYLEFDFPSPFDGPTIIAAIENELRHLAIEAKGLGNNGWLLYISSLGSWIHQNQAQALRVFLDGIDEEIKQSWARGDATGENAAYNLAVEFGRMELYRALTDG